MIRRSFFVRVLLLFYLVSWLSAGYGQKVALVLSGGGSRGAAHIGVIKALEEKHIPIHFIAGTSIGAIIGGLYACGYSTEEMTELLSSDDFQRWAHGVVDNAFSYYFLKPEPNSSWVNLRFSLKKKLAANLPTNIISPFEMDFEMMRITAPCAAESDYNFDNLMIPFRCVAADIDSGYAMIMRNGDLGAAIRASMTYPFYFKPLEINGCLLFDGGMYNNFPSDVAISEFHPDVIIGSKVAGNYEKPDSEDILSQIQNMLVEKTNYSVILEKGVLIEPHVDKVNLLDFSQTRRFADSGYVATVRKIEVIRSMVIDSIAPWEISAKRRAYREKTHEIVFDTILITGLKKGQAKYIRRMLMQKSDKITLDKIKKQYFRLLADDKIKYVFPKAIGTPGGSTYQLHLDIRKADPFGLQFGGNISTSGSNEGFIELDYQHMGIVPIRGMLNSYFGRFYNSIKGGARVEFPSRMPFYLEGYITYSHRDYFRTTTYFFQDKTPSFLIDNEQTISLSGGLPFTNKGKFESSFWFGYIREKYYEKNFFTREDTADISDFTFYSPQVLFELNTLNKKQYPNSGSYLGIDFHFVSGVEKNMPGSTSPLTDTLTKAQQWIQVKVTYDNYFQRIGPWKIGFYAQGLFSTQPLFRTYTSSLLYAPSFQPIPECQTLFLPSYRAPIFAAVGLKNIMELYKNIEFRLEGYLFQPYQNIDVAADGITPVYGPFPGIYNILISSAMVYHSPLGPLSLGLNYFDHADTPFSFSFNFGYTLFNRRAIRY